MGWNGLGWDPVFFSEIEPFPCAVLAHHYPDVPNLGDMTEIDGAAWRGKIDLLAGGTPCQSFSVAGLRKSLSDERGNLTLKFVELFHATGAVWAVWENVPGVLNTDDNAFGCLLAGLVGEASALMPPGGRWTDAGVVDGPEGTAAWRIIDAQYFGVAQRRRRVFVVVRRAGAGGHPGAVLFEPEGVRRNSAPGREAGEGVAALTANGVGTCGADDNQGQGGRLIAEVAPPLLAKGNQTGGDRPPGMCVDTAESLIPTITHPLLSKGNSSHDESLETYIAHTLRAEGFDASEDGTGRGTPIVPVAFPAKLSNQSVSEKDLCPTLEGCNPTAVAIQERAINDNPDTGPQGKGWQEGVAYTLEARNKAQAVAFHENQRGEVTTSETAGSLKTGGGKPGQGYPAVQTDMAVRRLTPRECEWLQGFPGDYTRLPFGSRKKIEASELLYQRLTNPELTMEEARRLASDGPRYKALGNSWAVPCGRWLGERIQMVVEAVA